MAGADSSGGIEAPTLRPLEEGLRIAVDRRDNFGVAITPQNLSETAGKETSKIPSTAVPSLEKSQQVALGQAVQQAKAIQAKEGPGVNQMIRVLRQEVEQIHQQNKSTEKPR